MQSTKRKLVLYTVAAIVLLVVIAGSFLIGKSSNKTPVADDKSGDYPLLAKRIFVNNPSDYIVNFASLRAQLQDYFTKNKLTGGVYFEYLPTGTSVKIDGATLYTAASLIKLPAAMDLYKASEMGKVSLDKTITLQSDWLDSAYGELYQKGAGYQLTLKDATKIMLEDSDNTALRAIGSSVNGLLKPNEQSFNSLDVDLRQDQNLKVSVSPMAYSSFLKCLYFACYLNYDHSQEILSYLSNSKFNDRIVAGVGDKNVKIAHKTGNFEQDTQSDCGIVYLKDRSYIICAMVKGQDSKITDDHIAQLSKVVFDFVSAIKGTANK